MVRKKQDDRLPDGLNRKADGRYRIKISLRDPDGKRIYRAKTLPKGTTEAQALGVLDELRAELEVEASPRTPSLVDYAERWIARKSRRWKASTTDTYIYRLSHHVVPFFGTTPIDQIEQRDLLAWRTDIESQAEAEDGPSSKTVQGWWRDGLRLIRSACTEHGLSDPAAGLEGPSVTESFRRERKTLSADELALLVEALLSSRRKPSAWPAIALMAYTGCRRGEALALRWEDVDLAERTATLQRAVYHSSRTGWKEGKPKSGRARIVGLPSRLVELLSEHRRQLVKEQHPGLEMGLVAPAGEGGYCSYRSLRQAITRAAARAGIEQNVTPQVLRRSYNTLALQLMDRVVAQAIIGHSDDGMSAHYLGLRTETIRDAADSIWGPA